MKTFFSSDYHLGHANIIKYDKRPFKNVSEMNAAIIDNHNSVVSPKDEFYFIGDFAFSKNPDDIYRWMKQLNGIKYFIKGNHDHTLTRKIYSQYGTFLGDMAEIYVNGQLITLNHYSMRVWNKSHHGAWHLYGHSHHSLPEDPNSLSFDVGINGWDYFPISFEQVSEKMATKNFKPIDHHTGDR